MAKTSSVLKSVADFAPGVFENTVVEGEGIQLGRGAGAYLQSGSYTSPPMRLSSFLRLVPSWNTDTPHGTAVEVQARVASDGQWSRWFSFGKWSPFINRAAPEQQRDEVAGVEGELITLTQGRQPADMAQIRIYLYSDEQVETPRVYLLALSADPVRREREDASRTDRILQVPLYASLNRDPAIAPSIGTPTSMAMLMNRWGADTLPEEVARASYDFGCGKYSNLAFASAIAGAYGFECYLVHGGVETLRQEVRRGCAVGAAVRYRAPALGSGQPPSPAHPMQVLPVLEGAAADSRGHLVVVRGFTHKGNEEWVVINDPLAVADAEVQRELPLSQFLEIYTGLALMLHKGPREAGAARPERFVGQLQVQNGTLALYTHGKEIFPAEVCGDKTPLATICYTLPEGVAYASAAQKKFYYLSAGEDGLLRFDPAILSGQKAAFYFITSHGQTWVSEKTFETAPE